ARTSRISTSPAEPPTTRFSAVDPVTERVESPSEGSAGPAGPDREIESWLGELRGGRDASSSRSRGRRGATNAEPSDDRTRSLPKPTEPAEPADNAATTAIPVQGSPENSPDNPATEKLTAPGNDAADDPHRRGATGGLSAAELLRREGRY
ncbi:MAG: hypothetical protein ABI253_12805, partial [Mycobacterium sp.]